jgi:hypothetical protein
MSGPVRNVAESLARRTSRRGLFGRSAELIFGVLAGTTAGAVLRGGGVSAGGGATVCSFPYGQPCSCTDCQSNGVCAKPCVILTTYYAVGCWVTAGVTCCDCDCPDQSPSTAHWCGCGSDYHNDPANCGP